MVISEIIVFLLHSLGREVPVPVMNCQNSRPDEHGLNGATAEAVTHERSALADGRLAVRPFRKSARQTGGQRRIPEETGEIIPARAPGENFPEPEEL